MPDINMMGDNMPQRPDNNEAAMARADLYKSANYSFKLFKMIQDGQELEGWVQAKITKAADYIASVYHYMEYEMKFNDYGKRLEDSDIYTESVKQEFVKKLTEARVKMEKLREKNIKDLKKADESCGSFEKPVKKKLENAKPDFLDVNKDGDKKEPMKKAVKDKLVKEVSKDTLNSYIPKAEKDVKDKLSNTHVSKDTSKKFKRDIANREKGMPRAVNRLRKDVDEASTGRYSAKDASAGKDIGKPGKQFSKIAAKAGKEYGSKERGEKVAGAVLAKLRKK